MNTAVAFCLTFGAAVQISLQCLMGRCADTWEMLPILIGHPFLLDISNRCWQVVEYFTKDGSYLRREEVP